MIIEMIQTTSKLARRTGDAADGKENERWHARSNPECALPVEARIKLTFGAGCNAGVD